MAARDLNQAFQKYLYTTLTGTSQTVDVTTLLAAALATVRAAQPTEVDDLNTLYKAYLP